jgi:hypothetical protein
VTIHRTPQTKVAHRVYTTYSDKFEKLKPFTDTAATALNRMRNPTPDRSPPRDNPHTSTDNLLHKDATRSHVYTEPDVDMPDVSPATTSAEAGSSRRFSKTPGIKFGGFSFGKQAAKPVGQRGLVITRPLETLPRTSGKQVSTDWNKAHISPSRIRFRRSPEEQGLIPLSSLYRHIEALASCWLSPVIYRSVLHSDFFHSYNASIYTTRCQFSYPQAKVIAVIPVPEFRARDPCHVPENHEQRDHSSSPLAPRVIKVKLRSPSARSMYFS